MSDSTPSPILSAVGLVKRFGRVTALIRCLSIMTGAVTVDDA